MGDGEPALPGHLYLWLELRTAAREREGFLSGEAGRRQREQALAELACVCLRLRATFLSARVQQRSHRGAQSPAQ